MSGSRCARCGQWDDEPKEGCPEACDIFVRHHDCLVVHRCMAHGVKIAVAVAESAA